MIKSAYEDSFLLDLIKSQTTVTPRGAWIGLIRKAADFKFYWIDDTPLERQYKAWAQGEPNNAGSKEKCVQTPTPASRMISPVSSERIIRRMLPLFFAKSLCEAISILAYRLAKGIIVS